MTVLTAAPAPTLRPVPWHRLGWVVWRRYRASLIAVGGVLALLAIDLVITGHRARAAYAAVLACTPAGSPACHFLDDDFHNRFGSTGFLGAFMMLLPGILGAFVGTPLLARELETGTFRYAWTQGAGRMRWALSLIVPGAVGLAGLMGAFGVLFRWRNQPLIDDGITARLQPSYFPVSGLAIAGWVLVGFALGLLAGLLWRRVLPGLATAFGAWFALAFLAAKVLRPHYEAPLRTTSLELSNHDLFLSQWWAKGGARVSDLTINQALQAIGVQEDGNGIHVEVGPGGSSVDPIAYLQQHGFRQVTTYQPGGRFWTFQWIEFGWLALLAIGLCGLALWLLRRRPA